MDTWQYLKVITYDQLRAYQKHLATILFQHFAEIKKQLQYALLLSYATILIEQFFHFGKYIPGYVKPLHSLLMKAHSILFIWLDSIDTLTDRTQMIIRGPANWWLPIAQRRLFRLPVVRFTDLSSVYSYNLKLGFHYTETSNQKTIYAHVSSGARD